MIFIQIGTTLIFIILITLIVWRAYKKLNAKDKVTFKRELLFDGTGMLFVGPTLLVISVIFQNQILMNLSIILILIGWLYQGLLRWKENRTRSILLFILVLIAVYISFILLN
ncbi:hypothetical protein ACOJQI_11750 [Bacillus salacetis]|uniref:hypothetical protein n=1 Tax=Bacillus salacetis TaxID=2315464 RepID=UPI003BA37BC4